MQVASFQDPTLIIDKVAGIHGSFLLEQAEKFFIGSNGPDLNPVNIWHVERLNSRMSVYASQNYGSVSMAAEEAEIYHPFLQTEGGLNLNLPSKQTLLDLTNEVGLTKEVSLTKEVGFTDLKGKGTVVDEVLKSPPTLKLNLGSLLEKALKLPMQTTPSPVITQAHKN